MNTAFFDLETTGISPMWDEPVQIAALVVNEQGVEVAQMNTLVKTSRKIHPGALAVHGITPTRLEVEGRREIEAIKLWQKLLQDHKPIQLVGYNCLAFDFPMLLNWIARHDSQRFKYPSICKVIDVMHLVGNYLETKKWLKLKDAAKELKISFIESNLHEAMADVRLTMAIYNTISL